MVFANAESRPSFEGPGLRRAPRLVQCPVAAILKFVICEQEPCMSILDSVQIIKLSIGEKRDTGTRPSNVDDHSSLEGGHVQVSWKLLRQGQN